MASLTVDLALAGIAVGSAAALTGIGLIVTYRATGVLNLAHGAIAMVTAYLLRQLVVVWHWPTGAAAALCLLVVAPGIGVVLDLLVFRPLAARGAGTAETLVATLGVFVLLVGAAFLAWGGDARADVPSLVSARPVTLPGGLSVRLDTLVQFGAVAVVALAVAAVTRWTRIGDELRAVVDNRRLAVLRGIDADRVAAVGWAFGSFTAGLAGVLLAPYLRLDPYGLSLLVLETMAVAVGAGMRSLPAAVFTALVVGVAQSELTALHPTAAAQPLVQAVGANLFVVALLVSVFVLPRIGGVGAERAAAALTRGRRTTSPVGWAACAVVLLLPLGLRAMDLYAALQVPALAIVLLSIVVVTGYGGQISLGQAGYAGLGALFAAMLSSGTFFGLPPLDEFAALPLAVLLVAPLGLLTGWPAIRRRGLALALTTFALGVAVSRFVFAQPFFTSGLVLNRPRGLSGDRAFYVFELALLTAALLVVRNLHRGRLGRALAAMRDHEQGAAAAGVPVPRLKLFAFAVGAASAALGGALLGMAGRAFDPADFDPVRGLLWFAAVVVMGADSALGAVLAAGLLVGLDTGTHEGVSALVVGVLAVLLGRFPGGLVNTVLTRREERGAPRAGPLVAPDAVLTAEGRRVRDRVRSASGRGP
ncbi:branched-chain amino acid ABC transporter permease [Wenjunlia tyrosinilytica]|uniref:ABC transporter permease n=1 Tax=Wenjunlia tyrosinilytica TaxID=1544741 RepID=A0A918DZW5_9ACTN|nr:hypothetical protein GCM10012280_52040 [Wenjunlia tyrosinilytica]